MLTASLGKRDHVHHVTPERMRAEDTEIGPFVTSSGIMAVPEPSERQFTCGSKGKQITTRVSLPFVSILANRSALETKEGRG